MEPKDEKLNPNESEQTEILAEQTERRLEYADKQLRGLSEIKDALFHPERLDEDKNRGIHEIVLNLSTRRFGAKEYHHEEEKYNDAPEDDTETLFKKRIYRQAILNIAQDLGFIGDKPLEPTNDFEKQYSLNSEPEKYDGEVEAIVVPAAAALSNYKRFYHAMKAISTGAIKTDKIVFAACERPVTSAEEKTMANAGFTCGKTEFDFGIQAVADIAGGFIDKPQTIEKHVTFNDVEYPVKVVTGHIMIDGKQITVDVVESPFDKTRRGEDGQLAKRANSEEIFFSAMTILDKDAKDKAICITSHDVWKAHQQISAEYIFGAHFDRKVFSSGPDNTDRLYYNDKGELDIKMAEALVDEMSKFLYELEKMQKFLDEKEILSYFHMDVKDKKKVLYSNKIKV